MHECIAEIGTSHLGSISEAKKLINAAKDSGAHTVKFQWVIANEIVSPLAGVITLPTGAIKIYDYFKSVEKPFQFYKELYKYTQTKGLQFLCSVFGLQSLENLYTLHTKNQNEGNVFRIKIASPEVNHVLLLRAISTLSKKINIEIILSTGLSSFIDIYKAINILNTPPKKANIKPNIKKITILRCVTAYPADIYTYNIKLLKKYQTLFNHQLFTCEIGLSDHSTDPYILPCITTALGSTMTEKHFSISKNHNKKSSPDDPIALQPEDFLHMTQAIAEVSSIYQKEGQTVALSYVKQKYGTQLVDDVLLSKKNNWHRSAVHYPHYETSRRSLCASQDIDVHDTFTTDNVSLVRSEKNLCSGIHAYMYDIILNKKSNKKIPKGTMIHYTDINPQ